MSERRVKHLTESDLQRLRTQLSRKRDELLAAQRSGQRAQRGIAGDSESENGDIAEQMIEQEAALRVGAFDAALLADIDRALKKLEDGNYGISEDSGAQIPLERLDIMPWARRTAEEEDRHSRRG
jgi:DnaK suppressor protein